MRITINKGDTLSSVASKYGTSVDQILKLNSGIKNPDLIQAGATLELPGESGGSAALPSTKSLDGTAPVAKSLPSVSAPQSRLLNFSNVLNEAVNIARTKRRTLQGETITNGIPEGVRSASDLTGLMKGINTVDENYIKPLTDTAIDVVKADITDVTDVAKIAGRNGASSDVLDKILASTDVASALKAAGSFYQDRTTDPTQKKFADGKLEYTPTDVADAKNILVKGTVSADGVAYGAQDPKTGFSDPKLYKQLHDTWVNKGGTSQGFVTEFPPKYYVDPAIKDLPLYLQNTTNTGSSLDASLDAMFGPDN